MDDTCDTTARPAPRLDLGGYVADIITRWHGRIIARVEYLTSVPAYLVQPERADLDARWFDEARLVTSAPEAARTPDEEPELPRWLVECGTCRTVHETRALIRAGACPACASTHVIVRPLTRASDV